MIRRLRRGARIGFTALLALQLSACLIEKVDSGVTAGAPISENENIAITFTKPSNASIIQTPDLTVIISGTVAGGTSINSVTWQNDRGGKGTANGKENFTTGNIALQFGTNNITVTAVDETGNTASKALTVQRENKTFVADDPTNSISTAMYSYHSDLRDAAPVNTASIINQQVYFFIAPSDNWVQKGISRIRIDCCEGRTGPGAGENFDVTGDALVSPWSHLFDLSRFEAGGTRRVRFTAFFQDGTQSSASIADFVIGGLLTETNSAPEISGSPNTSIAAGNRYDFQPMARDPNGDTMRFSIENKPSWASFDQTTGRLYGTPTAVDAGLTYDAIVISVSDGKITSTLRTFSITVDELGTGTASLSWSIPTFRTDNTPLMNLAGFNIYYGQNSGNYNNKIRITDSGMTSYMIENLSAGTWYFVVTAFDEDNLESRPSGEGSKTF